MLEGFCTEVAGDRGAARPLPGLHSSTPCPLRGMIAAKCCGGVNRGRLPGRKEQRSP